MFFSRAVVLFFISSSFALFQMEIMLIMTETTTVLTSRKMTVGRNPPQKRQMKNVLNFILNGTYNVTYPKLRKPVRLSSSADDKIEEEGANASSEYNRAMQMLHSIDNQLGNGDAEKTTGPGSSSDLLALENGNNSSRKKKSPEGWSKLDNSKFDECDSDYDYDFASSRHNANYKKHYRQIISDSEGENEYEGDDADDEDDAAADERDALLAKEQSRKRLDSHDVHRAQLQAHDHGHSHAHDGHGCSHCKSEGPVIADISQPPTTMRITTDDRR